MFGHGCYNMLLSQILFSLLRGGLVLYAVVLHVGYLNSFKWARLDKGCSKSLPHLAGFLQASACC